MGPDVPQGPGEEGYELEQTWFQACKLSHDLWCLCGDYRQHFLPGCGAVVAVGGEDSGAAAAGAAAADIADDIMLHFAVTPPDGEDDDG